MVVPKKIGDSFISFFWESAQELPSSLKLQIREIPHPWEKARVINLLPSSSSCIVDSLLPTSTYEFRLVHVGTDGVEVFGKGVAVDTLPAGCNDNKGGGGCTLQ